MIAVSAYQWRAALGVSTEVNPAASTHFLFGVATGFEKKRKGVEQSQEAQARVQNHLFGVRFLLIDEAFTIGLSHLRACSTNALRAIRAIRKGVPIPDGTPFGGLHTVLMGDPWQHRPIGDDALYKQQISASSDSSFFDNRVGQLIWRSFKTVYFLDTQHRQAADCKDGQDLIRLSHLFMQRTQATEEQVAELCDVLQAAVVTPSELQQLTREGRNPHVVMLRNKARAEVNRRLAIAQVSRMRIVTCTHHSCLACNTCTMLMCVHFNSHS